MGDGWCGPPTGPKQTSRFGEVFSLARRQLVRGARRVAEEPSGLLWGRLNLMPFRFTAGQVQGLFTGSFSGLSGKEQV